MREEGRSSKKTTILGWIVFALSAVVVILLGLLATSITERRAESTFANFQITNPVDQFEADNAKWGVNFPREYNSWELTKRSDEKTKYGGSAHRDHLQSSPNMVVMWAGYPFAKGYNAPRGHFNAIDDVTRTLRLSEATPGTCWTCKSPDVPRMMSKVGPEKFYSAKFVDWKDEIKNPIGCGDCHDSKTMNLRISRPALKEAFQRMGKDINKATHQEMRTLVCAQCHVEYYFKGKKEQYLTFPWDNGTTVESMEKYYEASPHRDWTHAISGAKMIKMQHPDYEIYQQGIHAFRGVSCADCHMPYKTEGGIKFTDHQVRSPLTNVANSCQVCHRWSEKEIRGRVESMQDKNRELLDIAEDNITLAHLEIGDAMKIGATDQELENVRNLVMKAQLYWDYVAASNGMGFHAPQESARILAKASNFAQESRMLTAQIRARHGATGPIQMPDIETKEKAQAFIQAYLPPAKAQKVLEPVKAEADKEGGPKL
ncbi:MAG TPA: ammonia-forming cytochrome c nitrite reductase subunit c552 [Fimbriimonas sp.]